MCKIHMNKQPLPHPEEKTTKEITSNSWTFTQHQGTSILILIQVGSCYSSTQAFTNFHFFLSYKSSDLHCSVFKAFMQIQVAFLSEIRF